MADLEEDSDESSTPDADDVGNAHQVKFTKLFTPQESGRLCKARVWNCGKGGQCSKKRLIPPGFCAAHKEQDVHEKLRYGRVDQVLTEQQLSLFFSALQKADPKTSGKEAQEALQEYKALKEHKRRQNKASLFQKKNEWESLEDLIGFARDVEVSEADIAHSKEDATPEQKIVELIVSKMVKQEAKEKRKRMFKLKQLESKSMSKLLVKACEVGVKEEDILRTERKIAQSRTEKQILAHLIISKEAEQKKARQKGKGRGKGKGKGKSEEQVGGSNSQTDNSISKGKGIGESKEQVGGSNSQSDDDIPYSDSDSSSETPIAGPKIRPRHSFTDDLYISTTGNIIPGLKELKELALTEEGAATKVVSGFDMWKAEKFNQFHNLVPRCVKDILQSRESGKQDVNKDKKRSVVEDVGLASAERLEKKMKVEAAASSAQDVARGVLAASVANIVAREEVSRATAAIGTTSPFVCDDSEYAGMFEDSWSIQLQPSG